MPITPRLLGAVLPSHEREATVRSLLAYAAGIGATQDAVFDDAARGLSALPQYCVSLEWPVVSDDRARALWEATPDELRRGVHATQDSVFHAPMRPGMRLRTEGQVVGLRATRAGALSTTLLRTYEVTTGSELITSWSQSMHRGVDIADTEASPRLDIDDPELAAPPEDPTADESAWSEISSSEIVIPREMPHLYTEAAEIWNPIHTERTVALAAGLPDIIVHGTATWALAGREIQLAHCPEEPTRLRRLRGRFRAMVIPGTSIRVEQRSQRISTNDTSSTVVHFRVLNAGGEEAVSDGLAVVADATR